MGPDGIEDEYRWPYRPSKLDVGSVYEEMRQRLERLQRTARKCTSFSLVTGPGSHIYDFTTCWDSFYERFRSWCKELKIKYVNATYVAEHLERADHYHGERVQNRVFLCRSAPHDAVGEKV